MRKCLSKFNDKSFTLHTPPLTTAHFKKVASGTRKNPVKYSASGVHRNHGYKNLHKVLKVALWIYMIDFLLNRVRPASNKKRMTGSIKKTTHGHVHWSDWVWKYTPCFRVD